MFGYIKIDKNELKVKDYNLFKSYYCGLCRTLKQEYGFPARYFLSYDTTFLAVLLAAISENTTDFCSVRCMANPMVRRPAAVKNDALSYAAAVNVLLVWFKLKDDWSDNHSLKAILLMPLMLRKKNKAKKRYPALYQSIDTQLKALSALEKENCSVSDAVAAVFGKLMAEIFNTELAGTEETRRVFSHVGFLLGRLIYLLDAWADREDDAKKKAYNPFLLEESEKEDVRLSLDYTLGELANTLQLLNFSKNQEIIENIVYLGLKQSDDSVFYETESPINCKKEKHHERPI
ncbi:MAG: hypothetical protein IJF61_00005 [Clostridia bacterium]|nr:hypothetical protein [Clostridia bacterium]